LAILLVVPVALDLVADHAPVGVPEDQTLTNFVIGAEEVKFLAELAVVAFFGFLELPEVLLELIFAFPGGAVDALEHGAFFVAAPICACDIQQFDRIRIDLRG